MHSSIIKLLLSTLLLSPTYLFGQNDSIKFRLVESLAKHIYSSYIDERIAKMMSDTIRNRLSAGDYDSTLNMDEFVYEINKDLRAISADNHISVSPHHFDPVMYEHINKSYTNRQRKRSERKWQKFLRTYINRTTKDMFEYGEIKILPGNIGYVEIKDFKNTSYSKKENKHRIAMNDVFIFLRNTQSIIIDLRENGGGKIDLAAMFCSYFTQISDPYFITTKTVYRHDSAGIKKELNFTEKLYTNNSVDKSLIGNKNIYILTSSRTFSAAELSVYKLKQINPNIKVVGEKITANGGNGHFGLEVRKYYSAIVPCIRIFDESKSNYILGTSGVEPDIAATADSAFIVAYNLSLIGGLGIINNKIKYYKKDPDFPDEKENVFRKNYDDYVGSYRKIVISKLAEKLYITYDLFSRFRLVPEAKDFFLTSEFEFIRFLRGKDNKISEIQIKHKDGYLEKFHKQ